MLNRVVLIGRLTFDPELRYTNSGVAVTKFSLAVNRNYANQQGEREADFIQIVTWRKLAENVAKFTRKGSLVGLEGRLQIRKYQNREGHTVTVAEVVADQVQFLDSRGGSKPSGGDPFQGEGKEVDFNMDDLDEIFK